MENQMTRLAAIQASIYAPREHALDIFENMHNVSGRCHCGWVSQEYKRLEEGQTSGRSDLHAEHGWHIIDAVPLLPTSRNG